MLRGMPRFWFAIALVLAPLGLCAGEVETDLNGFRLQQFVKVAESELGRPYETIDAGDSVVNAYRVDQDAYMIVGHHKKYPKHISTLQLTGLTTKALPFKGLVLGDPEAKVLAALGEPDSRRKTESPPVVLLSYRKRNYSVELDNEGRLYSIQIFTNADVINKANSGAGLWADFKAAVRSKDFLSVSEMLRPDVEIYKSGKVLSIQRRYSEFVRRPDKAFVSALFGDKDSVLQELARSEPEEELRMVLDFGMGRVFKFPNGRILREIAFFPYNGKYRVYEIAFRERAK
jgi:hypothetical protein